MEDNINKKIKAYIAENCGAFMQQLLELKNSITCSECVSVALGIQHAIRLRRVASSLACPLVQYFPHYFIHGTIFERHVIEYKMCV